jgi:hypothetical protein
MSSFVSISDSDLINLNGGAEDDYEFGKDMGKLYRYSLLLNPVVFVAVENYVVFKVIYNALT